MNGYNKRLRIFVPIVLLSLFLPNGLYASSGMGGIGELGVFLGTAFLICLFIQVVLLVIYIFYRKGRIKSKFLRSTIKIIFWIYSPIFAVFLCAAFISFF